MTFAGGRQREPNRVGPVADADQLPLLVELGHLPDRYLKPEGGEPPNWLQFLPEYLTTQMTFTDTPPHLLTQALADGRCLLLFDGLDEIADNQMRARLARSLAEQARLSPGNRVIIGSRPAGVSESEGALRPHFQRCQIERFTPGDVQRFFRFWYALDRDLTPAQQREAADALYARVQATPATLQLATTPLLSTILVLIWRNEGDLPKRLVELYERCCRVLIERWETSHDVAYQGALVGMDWEDHLRLLTPLAYTIHSQEQRTSATREELLPLLAQALHTAGHANEQAAATREAKRFLDTLSLRSGLLQYMGNGRYGFPHLTFQEYLAARYIATQPDPEFIDLVMTHLHEAWWQQVHQLTIAQLGSGKERASGASTLILTILNVYSFPNWILRFSGNPLRRMRELAKLLAQVRLERQLSSRLAREFELAARGSLECVLEGLTATVRIFLSAQATSLVRDIVYNKDRRGEQEALFTVACQFLQHLGDEAAVNTLLEALHDSDWEVRRYAAACLGRVGVGKERVANALLKVLHDTSEYVQVQAAASLGQIGVGNQAVINALLEALHDSNLADDGGNLILWWNVQVREQAATSLGQIGVGNEAVVNALLEALHDTYVNVTEPAAASLCRVGVGNEVAVNALLKALHDRNPSVRRQAAACLGRLEITETIQLHQMLVVLNRCLYSRDNYVSRPALVSVQQLLDGRPIPGYRWVPLRKRRERKQRLKRVASWLGMIAVLLVIGLAATWLLGALDPNGFPVRFLAVLAGIIAFIAAVAQVLGRTLRDPWDRL